MKIKLLIICLNLIYCYNNSILDCESDQIENCIPSQNNFIQDYLSQIELKEKIKSINSVVELYSKKNIQVKKTEDKGLGIFLNESIQPRDKVFFYETKKIINSMQINQRLFFQNSLTRSHKKIKINQKLLEKILQKEQHEKIKETVLMTINFFYHFSRVQNSFLKNDLIGFPIDSMIPLFRISKHEFGLFKTNLQFEEIEQMKKSKVDEHVLLMSSLMKVFGSQEQLSYYFHRDTITLNEFLYIHYIISSRTHEYQGHTYLFPILHYTNQKSDIRASDYKILYYSSKFKLNVYSTRQLQLQNSEYLINYGLETFTSYAFFMGFVPQIIDLECNQLQILKPQLSQQLNVDSSTCLNDASLSQYAYYLMYTVDENIIQNCMDNLVYLENEMNKVDSLNKTSLQNFYLLLYKECFKFYQQKGLHQPFNIFDDVKNIIFNQKNILMQNLQELQQYLELKQNHQKNYFIAQLLLDYQKNFYNLVLDSELNLSKFLSIIES